MPRSLSSQTVRLLCALAAVVFCGYAGLLAAKSVVGFPDSHTSATHWPYLGDKPVGEDGFYMLTVSQNLASTGKLVYTHGMPATGIQPLSTIVFGGIAFVNKFFGGDEWTLIRWIIVFGSGCFVLFAFSISEFASQLAPPARRNLVFALAFFLALCDFSLFRLFTYGLETGLYLCCIAACLLLWRRIVAPGPAKWRDILLFGIVGGFAGLARIDFGLLFAILLAFLLIRRLASLLQILVAGLIALAIVSPWFIFVHSVNGSWLPSSGKAESLLISGSSIGRLLSGFLAVMNHLAPWTFYGVTGLPGVGVALVSLAVLGFLAYRAPQTIAELRSSGALRPVFLPWALGCASLVCVYVVFFWSSHFYCRYFGPIACISIPLLALALSEQPLVAKRPAVLLAGLAIVFTVWDIATLHTGRMGSTQLIAAGYVHRYYPQTRVGSFQSGTVAYFNPEVENLDGKLNQGALQAEAAHQLPQFLDAEKISVLVDWQGYLDRLPPSYRSSTWQACPQPMPTTDNLCLIRKPVH